MCSLMFDYSNCNIRKKSNGSKNSLLSGIAILSKMNSCTKISMSKMYGMNGAGNNGDSGGPGTNEFWIHNMVLKL